MFSVYPDKTIPFGDDCNIDGLATVSASIDIFLLKREFWISRFYDQPTWHKNNSHIKFHNATIEIVNIHCIQYTKTFIKFAHQLRLLWVHLQINYLSPSLTKATPPSWKIDSNGVCNSNLSWSIHFVKKRLHRLINGILKQVMIWSSSVSILYTLSVFLIRFSSFKYLFNLLKSSLCPFSIAFCWYRHLLIRVS